MQKSQKKKKKNSYATFSLADFLFPVIKRAEKVSGFVFFPKGKGKNVNKCIKKGKKIFPLFGRFFNLFWSLVCQKR